MRSEAPCRGGGLSGNHGNCQTNYSLHTVFEFLTTRKSNIFPSSQNFKRLPP